MKTGKNPEKITIITVVSVLFLSVLIKLSSFHPTWIENYYSCGIYPFISRSYRFVFGWLPFSFGDILYATAGFLVLAFLIRIVKIISAGEFQIINYNRGVRKVVILIGSIYIYFNLAWGLNYNRPGIAYQLGLQPEKHSDEDLKLISSLLLDKVNERRLALGVEKIQWKPYTKLFDQAEDAYRSAVLAFPFLKYKCRSVKPSLYGKMGNFLGFSGYYNPFSGEAQVNLTQPIFLVPYVTCHEIAHQLGYASESEASFVGYLAASSSSDTLFQYSAYFDMFNYANRELFLRDSSAAKNNYKKLDTLVKRDEKELYEYWRMSDNIIEPVIKLFYDHYLKANQQVKGVKSYNEVIGWLIAYYKKYGKI